MSTVYALFKSLYNSEEALRQLDLAGIRDSQISLVMTDQTRGAHFKLEEGTKTDEGAAAGATFGGIVGAVLGAVASAGILTIPGLNLVVTGALVSGLAGLGAGAAIGGLVGGLVGMGIPEHEAKLYEKEIQRGSILMAVKIEDDTQRKKVKSIFESLHAENIAA